MTAKYEYDTFADIRRLLSGNRMGEVFDILRYAPIDEIPVIVDYLVGHYEQWPYQTQLSGLWSSDFLSLENFAHLQRSPDAHLWMRYRFALTPLVAGSLRRRVEGYITEVSADAIFIRHKKGFGVLQLVPKREIIAIENSAMRRGRSNLFWFDPSLVKSNYLARYMSNEVHHLNLGLDVYNRPEAHKMSRLQLFELAVAEHLLPERRFVATIRGLSEFKAVESHFHKNPPEPEWVQDLAEFIK